jgi:hypothetical protein
MKKNKKRQGKKGEKKVDPKRSAAALKAWETIRGKTKEEQVTK